MKKYLTHKNATIAGFVGLALMVASIFLPRPWDTLAYILGVLLFMIDLASTCYQRGYSKGLMAGAAKEARIHFHATGNAPYTTKTFREGATK